MKPWITFPTLQKLIVKNNQKCILWNDIKIDIYILYIISHNQYLKTLFIEMSDFWFTKINKETTHPWIHKNIRICIKDWECTSVVEHLSNRYNSLSSSHSTKRDRTDGQTEGRTDGRKGGRKGAFPDYGGTHLKVCPWETKAGRPWTVPGWPGLYRETLSKTKHTKPSQVWEHIPIILALER